MGEYQYTEYDQYNNGVKTHDSHEAHANNTNINDTENYLGYILLLFVGTIFCSYACSVLQYRIKDKCKEYRSLKEKIFTDNVDITCSICLEDFKKQDKYIEFKCEHIYHKECIKEWFKKQNNCPNCRKIII